jgi:transcriptional regulator with XRE-family HTH domain
MGDPPHEALPKLFGRAVRESRDALGISQEELAARSKLHRTYVAGVERGIRNPSLKSIARIAEGLGMTVSVLFQRMERMRRGRADGSQPR